MSEEYVPFLLFLPLDLELEDIMYGAIVTILQLKGYVPAKSRKTQGAWVLDDNFQLPNQI